MINKSFILKWLILTVIVSLLASCGGGGGGTDGNPDPDPGTGEGDSAHPVLLTVGEPHNGSIGLAGVSYYYFNTGGTGDWHTISLTNTSKILAWYLYSDAAYTMQVDSCAAYASGDKVCFANLNPGVHYYLKVYSFSTTSSSTYTVTVNTGGGNEGGVGPGAQTQLAVGTPYSATISANGDSYYAFTAGADGSYIISLTNTHSDLGWELYSDNGFVTPVGFWCDVSWNAVNEVCSTPNLIGGATYYLKVFNDDFTDDSFTITINKGSSEGSKTSPVNLTVGSPHVGAVDGYSNNNGYGNSYYKFTTDSSATSSYHISLSNVQPQTASTGLYVYSDPNFTNSVATCYSSTGDKTCSAQNLSPGTTYYINVSNGYLSPSCTYTITVTKGGSEGSVSRPVNLVVGASHAGGVDVSGNSYYSLTTNSGSGGSYTISLSDTQSNVSWTLYNDAAFSSSLWGCNNAQAAGPGDESCASTNLDANRTYYLKVTNLESVSSTYTVTVNYGGGSVGSRNNPMVLPIGTLHAGGVLGYGFSYYSITTGSSAMLYLISLTNTQADLQWDIYTDSAYSYSLGLGCNKATGIGDENCSTQLLNANTTYYLKVRSNSSNYSSYDLKATPLDPAQGCSASASQCFTFDDGLVPASFVLTTTVITGNKNASLWKIDSTNNAATGGTASLRSGTLPDDKHTCFEYVRSVDTTAVLFTLMTSTEAADELNFYIDGVGTGGFWYGTTPWRRVIFFVDTPGAHAFKWCYEKSLSGVAGSDATWVDDIEFR